MNRMTTMEVKYLGRPKRSNYFPLCNLEQPSTSANQLSNKRRGSVAADFAPHRLIVSERQQMAVLKQLTAGEESNSTCYL